MDKFYARSVFFVADAERSLAFYTNTLGFTLDWNHQEQGKAFVLQVSLHGLELILNQAEPGSESRVGQGRVFIGLDDAQAVRFREHVKKKGIKVAVLNWGAPTCAVHDLDGNEMFFWLPETQRANLEAQFAGA